ncbi:MAG: hypothetical protein BZ138_06170 [Methanosphaera sp. rholeuAM270]|nr:MAG: hypothetical protein BZ138_06170 [Methanosphaera sp. rholeuAM270]
MHPEYAKANGAVPAIWDASFFSTFCHLIEFGSTHDCEFPHELGGCRATSAPKQGEDRPGRRCGAVFQKRGNRLSCGPHVRALSVFRLPHGRLLAPTVEHICRSHGRCDHRYDEGGRHGIAGLCDGRHDLPGVDGIASRVIDVSQGHALPLIVDILVLGHGDELVGHVAFLALQGLEDDHI